MPLHVTTDSPLPALRAARADELDRLISIDEDACTLFVEVGRDVEPSLLNPFVVAEHARWRESLVYGRVVVAVTREDEPIAFASLGVVDGEPLLQQLSVRRAWMRRGIGRALVGHAVHSIAGAPLWLTTYADLPWNRPAYERMGFSCVDDARCGDEMRRILEEERRVLPAPEQRVAMVRPPNGPE